jgi:hypothetical protein
MNTDKFFGEAGVFQQACELYQKRAFSQAVALHSASLGASRIAYCLGHCFAAVLRTRAMPITDEDLEAVAKRASSVDWREFVNGFRR